MELKMDNRGWRKMELDMENGRQRRMELDIETRGWNFTWRLEDEMQAETELDRNLTITNEKNILQATVNFYVLHDPYDPCDSYSPYDPCDSYGFLLQHIFKYLILNKQKYHILILYETTFQASAPIEF